MQNASSQTGESSVGCGVLSHDGVLLASAHTGLHRGPARLGMLLVASAFAFAAACSDDASPGATGGAGASGGSGGSGGAGGMCNATSTACACQTDPMDIYVANMAKPGVNKQLTFQLIQSNPGPPIKGNNDWKVKITDSAGTAVGTGLTVKVWMPKHVHDSLTAPKITYDTASSTFRLNPIDLGLMGGLWRITLMVDDTGGVTADKADFDFCVE
jgi:hypothetical protein